MTEGTPGQTGSVTFHEVAKTAALAAPSHPTTRTRRKRSGRFARAKAREREVEEGDATGVSEVRSHRAPWEEDAHAHDSGRRVSGSGREVGVR
jgi:hypothetical protein